MDSYRRNSHKSYRVLGVAGAVALLLGQAVQAADTPHNFVLTAYSNGAGGAELISGQYQAATEALHKPPALAATDRSVASNNRCVALTMTKQWDAARAACDRAVRDAQLEKMQLPSYQYWARKQENEYLAVALSNRAVLHWIASDSEGAANDLKRAATLAPDSDFVVRNRTALEYSRTSVAQVAVAPAASQGHQ